MISPTGMGVRKADKFGQGIYGASRGGKIHKGTDYICEFGQDVYSPINGTVIREARPYASHEYSGVLIQNKWIAVKMFYFQLDYGLVGKQVEKGQVIGQAQDISKKYPGMIPHIHFEIESVDPEIFTGML